MALPSWSKVPSWVEENLLPPLLRAHDAIYQKTNGWIGHRTLGVPSLLLHTVGAKTGKARTTSLSYARDSDDYLIVASKGGDPRAPGWYHNLRKNPNVEINVGPKRFGVTAKPVLPDDPDYGRLWQIVNKNNGNRYAGYQEKTSRPIPVIVLTP
jgi:deazaflavin-dependent oxidoreductase (nitroreductase family)